MKQTELKHYYFSSIQIETLFNKYFDYLIEYIGLENLILKNISSQDDIVKAQDNIETKIKKYLTENKTVYLEFSEAYQLNSYVFLSEILLQSIYAKLYIENQINFDIFLSKQSALYFENEYPENIKEWQRDKSLTILDICKFYKIIANLFI